MLISLGGRGGGGGGVFLFFLSQTCQWIQVLKKFKNLFYICIKKIV